MSKHSNNNRRGVSRLTLAGGVLLAVMSVFLCVIVAAHARLDAGKPVSAKDTPPPMSAAVTTPTLLPSPTPLVTEPPVTVQELDFHPHAVEGTQPELLVESTEIMQGGELVESYAAEEDISFGYGSEYTDIVGVSTFRGNNFRDGGTWGFSTLTAGELTKVWNVPTGALQAYDGTVWVGSGWVGQPIIVKWPQETKNIMKTMYSSAKEKDGLVEVIYATMDGFIYFIDLETGHYTRDALYIGYTFKGAGTLDPRGYPILYVGAGYNSKLGLSRAFAISLIDGKILYEFGNNDAFSTRTWYCFDGAPIVDADTDTLIWAAESGLLYLIKLNTEYDEAAGTLTLAPEQVKWRYNGVRTGSKYWVGMETSVTVLQNYAFFADNGGILMCIDLNTLELVWAQDTLDDTNCTPVLSIEGNHPYLYVSTSFHGGWRAQSWDKALIPVWKIDAETGEIVWQNDEHMCYTEDSVSGGVQGTIAVGKYELEGLVFVPFSRTPSAGAGILAALDSKTGETVWERQTQIYSWSSPVVVYDEDGRGYIIYTTTGGYMYLVCGQTGEILASLDCGSNIEATAAVYEDMVVVGSRLTGIFGVKLS